MKPLFVPEPLCTFGFFHVNVLGFIDLKVLRLYVKSAIFSLNLSSDKEPMPVSVAVKSPFAAILNLSVGASSPSAVT